MAQFILDSIDTGLHPFYSIYEIYLQNLMFLNSESTGRTLVNSIEMPQSLPVLFWSIKETTV